MWTSVRHVFSGYYYDNVIARLVFLDRHTRVCVGTDRVRYPIHCLTVLQGSFFRDPNLSPVFEIPQNIGEIIWEIINNTYLKYFALKCKIRREIYHKIRRTNRRTGRVLYIWILSLICAAATTEETFVYAFGCGQHGQVNDLGQERFGTYIEYWSW